MCHSAFFFLKKDHCSLVLHYVLAVLKIYILNQSVLSLLGKRGGGTTFWGPHPPEDASQKSCEQRGSPWRSWGGGGEVAGKLGPWVWSSQEWSFLELQAMFERTALEEPPLECCKRQIEWCLLQAVSTLWFFVPSSFLHNWGDFPSFLHKKLSISPSSINSCCASLVPLGSQQTGK